MTSAYSQGKQAANERVCLRQALLYLHMLRPALSYFCKPYQQLTDCLSTPCCNVCLDPADQSTS